MISRVFGIGLVPFDCIFGVRFVCLFEEIDASKIITYASKLTRVSQELGCISWREMNFRG